MSMYSVAFTDDSMLLAKLFLSNYLVYDMCYALKYITSQEFYETYLIASNFSSLRPLTFRTHENRDFYLQSVFHVLPVVVLHKLILVLR